MPIIRSNPGWMIVKDEMGYILETDNHMVPSRQEWQQMRDEIDVLYEGMSDAIIDMLNRQERERQQRAMADALKHVDSPKEYTTDSPGYIYLLYGEGTPWHKIGVTKKPLRRINDISAKAPFPIVLVCIIPVMKMVYTEQYWHDRFADKRVEGEWFLLTDEDVNLFVNSGRGVPGDE